ncbi:MAG: YicC family protein [Xanthomonadaceae bacterium]|nr:YicC family protein [Xanthomonadaceae bacterium]
MKQQAHASMTGFAVIEGKIGKLPVKIEIKSLNHRFIEIKLRIPREFTGFDSAIKSTLTQGLSRGSIEFSLQYLKEDAKPGARFTTDMEAAKSYLKAASDLQKKLKLKGKVEISQLLTRGDFIKYEDQSSTLDSEKNWVELKTLIDKAIVELKASREKEGSHLMSRVFHPMIADMRTGFEKIGKLRDEGRGAYKDKIKSRIDALFQTYNVETHGTEAILETRLAQELALLLDRTDIEEERVRFGKHIDHLDKIFHENGPVGKKIDFVLQELGREINTLGNKAQDVAISEEVVKIKVKLEQLREQGLNLE